MAGDEAIGSPQIRRRLQALAGKPINFDLACVRASALPEGWALDDRCQPLPGEPPGAPVPGGSWEIARRLIRGYEFADPSVVRAYYDPDAPLAGRNMLLRLRALGRVDIYVGVRVGEVFDETRSFGSRSARVWGWNYRTLEGHVEMGQMAWEVWKWLDSGEVEFRVHAVSRRASIRNPIVWLGFRLFGAHERRVFLHSTNRRMLRFTELGLDREGGEEPIRQAAADLTAREQPADDPAPDSLARHLSEAGGSGSD
ncbi:MAG: DUF1990 domain-containing protein [Actinomycetota bacterium]|nr:DUF1990 domain-containing protein [Actinomycetota bacterium]